MTGGFEALHFKKVLKKLSVLMALEEIESMFVGFLSTSECFSEYQNAVETLACSPCSSAFFILPNFHSCFYNSTETRSMFPFSGKWYGELWLVSV